MSTVKKKHFIGSEEAARIEEILRQMAKDSAYNTTSSYSANITQYPDHLIPFVDKHMNYLKTHPSLDPQHYLANLRLMTKIR